MKGALVLIILCVCSLANAQHSVLRDSVHTQAVIMSGVRHLPAPMLHAVTIPRDQYTRCFGFFCRQELKMQKAHILVSFRLGSMEMTNRMEGKSR